MRLIDADKIKWDIGTVWPDVGTRVVPYSDIERAETVEGITVEWIQSWCNKEENYYSFKDFGKRLIADWRKENE